jgi:hypothetical protein
MTRTTVAGHTGLGVAAAVGLMAMITSGCPGKAELSPEFRHQEPYATLQADADQLAFHEPAEA